jgi:hypothetical protein
MTSPDQDPVSATPPNLPEQSPSRTLSRLNQLAQESNIENSSGKEAGPTYRSLREVIAGMNLDVLTELESFRQWQQTQKTPSQGLKRKLQSQSSRSRTLNPQEVLEDLENEETPSFLPGLMLFLWLVSCAGITLGTWWLLSPGDPNRSLVATQSEMPIPKTGLDLTTLPLIPVSPEEGEPAKSTPQIPKKEEQAKTESSIDLDGLRVNPLPYPSWLDFLQQDKSTLTSRQMPRKLSPAPRRERQPLQRVALIQPTPAIVNQIAQQPSPSVDPLKPDQGEGTFLVLINYQGDESLNQARQFAQGAFVKDIGGQKYIQLASFEQLEYARYMVDTLKNQGITATVSSEN